jgi:outer membrane protein assembly factor BamB
MIVILLVLTLQDGLIASPEAGWPQWRGPYRDGVSREKGLLPSWPAGGPPRLWRLEGLGKGWAQPILAGQPRRIFVAGDVGADCVLGAWDLDGKQVWKARNGASWSGSYPGARAAATYSKGKLYHLNAHGRAACFDAATGREVWAVDILERFGAENITWALSEGLLVEGDRVIVTPGGRKAFLAALDAATGATVWSGEPLPEPDVQRTGYASPILIRRGGRRLLVTLALRCLVGADADTGKILWTFGHRTRYDASASTPVFADGRVFYELPMRGAGGVMLRLGDGGVEKLWTHPLDACNAGAVAVDGVLYGSGYDVKHWVALDVESGAERNRWNGIPRGTLAAADGRLYALSESGEVALLDAALAEHGRFRLAEGRRDDVWTHPVILDGLLYLRDHDALSCYDVRAR